MSPQLVGVYTPMIVDWADLKLSKNLYVRRNSYEYLKSLGMEFLVSFKCFRNREGSDHCLIRQIIFMGRTGFIV